MRRLLTILLLLATSSSPGQVERHAREDRTSLSDGIVLVEKRFRDPEGVIDYRAVEVAEFHRRASLDLSVPPEGFHASATPEELIGDSGALSVFVTEPSPAAGEDAGNPGLHLRRGQLVAWPPTGQTYLLLSPEGGAELYLPEAGRAALEFDDGTSVTIISLNGRLPDRGETAVVTGRLDARDLPAAAWPDDLAFFPLKSERAVRIESLLMPPLVGDYPLFEAGRPQERRSLDLERGQGALVFRKPVPSELMAKLAGKEPFRLRFPLSERERMARGILPAGSWIVRDGEVVEEVEGTDLPGNLLAIDSRKQRVAMVNLRFRGRPGARRWQGMVLQKLMEDGFDQILAPEQREPALYLAKVIEDSRIRERYRAALLAVPEGPTFEGETGESYSMLRPVTVTGPGTAPPTNNPLRLIDREMGWSQEADTFWAGTIPPAGSDKDKRVLEFFFSPRAAVTAMDLYHVETAGFSPKFNLKSFRILGRASQEQDWRLLAERFHEEPVAIERIPLEAFRPVSHLRIEIIEPNFLVGGTMGRLVEVTFWGEQK